MSKEWPASSSRSALREPGWSMFHSVLGKSGCAKQGHARWRAEGFVPVFEEQLCLRHPAHGGRHHGRRMRREGACPIEGCEKKFEKSAKGENTDQ